MRHHDDVFLQQRRFHNTADSALACDVLLADGVNHNPVVAFGTWDKCLAGPFGDLLSPSTKDHVEETAIPSWSKLKLKK